MLDPKRVYVGISILGGGSIEVFDLDDEQSKRKVNGSNRRPKHQGRIQREITSTVCNILYTRIKTQESFKLFT